MNIFVIEDDDMVAALLEHIFKRHGHAISHAFDGREALRRIEGDDVPDVILLDYMLPFASGIEILEAIRKADGWKDVPVLFLSARTGNQDVAKAMEAGADDYLTKPFGVDELEKRVRSLVGG